MSTLQPDLPQMPFTLSTNEPSLIDVLNLLKKDILLELNCHHVGTIQSFNALAMTVTATVNYSKTFFELDSSTGQYSPVQVNYPVLVDCPIVVLGGGLSNLTFPIANGDECLLLFNDRDLDNWFTSGQVSQLASARLHSFSDAFALVGVKSSQHVLTNYDTTRAVLRNGTNGSTMVGVGPSLVKIANANTTLNTLLQSLITNISNLVTACAAITVTGVTSGGSVSGVPANASTITAISSNLSTLATQIGGLLE